MEKVFVENIRERDQVEAPFLVRDKIMGLAKNGRPYMTLKLMDRTGEVEGRVWERVDELAELFEKDDFVRVSGKASVYLGKMQLIIQELVRLEESDVSLEDFLPVSLRPADEMLTEFHLIVESLECPHLKQLMTSFADDREFMRSFQRAPAAKTMHHVCLGGLLEHSLAVAALVRDICARYPGLNQDLLLVGALLHDVGKTIELRYQRSFEYTDSGKLLGHIMLGVELVEKKLSAIRDFPIDLAVHLKHLLLSHHGQYEYGSPKRPKTLEAIILNYLDDLDSKINGVMTHIEREPDRDSEWTQYHKQYDRYFYKGPKAGKQGQRDFGGKEQKRGMDSQGPAKKGKPRFGNTLEEQLKAKKFDLVKNERQDRGDE